MEFQEDSHIRVSVCLTAAQLLCRMKQFPSKRPYSTAVILVFCKEQEDLSCTESYMWCLLFWHFRCDFSSADHLFAFWFPAKTRLLQKKNNCSFLTFFILQVANLKPMGLKCVCSEGDAKGGLAACLFEYWCISLQILSFKNMLWIVTV